MLYTDEDRAVQWIENHTIYDATQEHCHMWAGSFNSAGYASFKYKRRTRKVVNWLWDYVHGTPPKGMQHCHKCNNRWCINLAHIYIGTPKQNAQDVPKPTHCPIGHEYTEENTVHHGTKRNKRCRKCEMYRHAAEQLRKKPELLEAFKKKVQAYVNNA